MKTQYTQRLPLALALLGALTTTALAQDPVALVKTGDMYVTPLGTFPVTDVFHVEISDTGSWAVEARIDTGDFNTNDVTIINGVLTYHKGTDLNLPAGSTFNSSDTIDINASGDILQIVDFDDLNGGTDGRHVLWNSFLLMEQGLTPVNTAGVPMTGVWDSIAEVWQNDSNQLLVGGGYDTGFGLLDMLVLYTHDGMGTLGAGTLYSIEDSTMPGHLAPVQGYSFSQTRQAINDLGQVMFYVDDDNTQTMGGGANNDFDSWMYLGDSPPFTTTSARLNENDPCPADMARTFGHWSTAEVDINNAGDYVISAVLDSSDTSNNNIIFRSNGSIVAREGSAPPGFPSFLISSSQLGATMELSETGDVLWFCDWDDMDTDVDSGVFINQSVFIHEGTSTVGGVIVDTIGTGSEDMAMSDNGRYVAVELTLLDGTKGEYLYDRGSIATSYCVSALNDSGSEALMSASGSASLGAADLVLRAGPVGMGQTPGIFYFSDAAAGNPSGFPFGEGNRCVVGAVTRLNPPVFQVGGFIERPVNNGNLPMGVSIGVGTTQYFQCWFRDTQDNNTDGNASGFNLSDALEITFEM